MVACLASDILELMLGKPMRFLATNKNSQKSIIVRGLNAVQPWALEIIREKGSERRKGAEYLPHAIMPPNSIQLRKCCVEIKLNKSAKMGKINCLRARWIFLCCDAIGADRREKGSWASPCDAKAFHPNVINKKMPSA